MIKAVYSATINATDLGLPTEFDSIGDIVGSLLPAAIAAAGIASLGIIVLGGFKYLTAAGDDKLIKQAQKTITGAVIGLVIVAFAYTIMRILETVLGINIT